MEAEESPFSLRQRLLYEVGKKRNPSKDGGAINGNALGDRLAKE